MNWLNTNWFKLVATICFLLIAISITFYFLYFLPTEKRNLLNEKQEQTNFLTEKQTQPEVEKEETTKETTSSTTSLVAESPSHSFALPKPATKPAEQSPKTYSEGWVEKLKPNSALAGWAFDNNKPVVVKLTFKELDIGFEATLTGNGDTNNGSSGSFYFSFRKDVEDLIRQKGIEPYVRTGFQLNTGKGDLPSGFYKLVKATYNGKSFMIQEPDAIYHFEKCYMSGGNFICE